MTKNKPVQPQEPPKNSVAGQFGQNKASSVPQNFKATQSMRGQKLDSSRRTTNK